MAEVILKNIDKFYEKNHVIKNVSLEIADREFLVLVGPSGCGKSTLLRMIAGLEEISSGEILIGGKVVNNLSPKDRDISMVFQNYALYPHMNVYDNMGFGLKIRKFPKNEIDTRVSEAAEILGISHLLDRKPKALSGGQRQRVALGRAIVRKPKVFLFDEPLSNLDAKLRVHMRTEIAKLHNRLQTTMIYVTHDQVEAMTMGDRIAVLNEGIVQQHDTPLNLYNEPSNRFVAGFIGSPAMNFLDGELRDGKLIIVGARHSNEPLKSAETAWGSASPLLLDGFAGMENPNVAVGIRPEHLTISDESPHFKAAVDVVEPMGNEIFVYFMLAGKQVVARIPANYAVRDGDVVPFRIDTRNIKLFDGATGARISGK